MAVLVWIHGGGNVDGESNDYDGSKLATGGALGTPTVVVTINYRLNLFGFLAHPALDSEGHPGPAGDSALGAAQYRGLWWRPSRVAGTPKKGPTESALFPECTAVSRRSVRPVRRRLGKSSEFPLRARATMVRSSV
jgi:hypothetical protein